MPLWSDLEAASLGLGRLGAWQRETVSGDSVTSQLKTDKTFISPLTYSLRLSAGSEGLFRLRRDERQRTEAVCFDCLVTEKVCSICVGTEAM